jgi:hypothetical protein
MPKSRMTKKEKEFYQKMLKAFKLGVKVSDLPGPLVQKWATLHTTKTY